MSVQSHFVAVILLNWNGLNDTLECLDSLQQSTCYGVIPYVVDNASKGNEAEIIKQRFPSSNVLPQHENLGFCEGNNVGIKQALEDGAEYILVLNNDTLVPANAIEILVEEFLKLPDAGAISPVIMEYPATDKVWFAKAAWDGSRAQFNLNPEKSTYDDLKNRKIWQSEFACGCCLLTSARVLKEVGLLDDRYFAYYDEADWCKRLEKNGYRSYVTPASFIYHKVSQSTTGLVSTYLMTRNRLLWMNENLSFARRMKSYSYLSKELIWHRLNASGLVKGQYSKAHSKAFLRGWVDYRLGRFGKWDTKTEKKLFPPKGL